MTNFEPGCHMQLGVSVMSTFSKTLSRQWQDTANFMLGIWLIISPRVLQYTDAQNPTWNAYAVGVIIAVAAAAASMAFHQWEEWVHVLLGTWPIVRAWMS